MKTEQKTGALRAFTKRSEFSVLIGLVAIFLIMSVASPYFLKVTNIMNVLQQISRYGIISVGMALVMITGGIDLSVGYIVALCACMAAHLTTNVGMPWPVVLVIVLALGALIGAMIIGILKNAFILLKVSSYWQSVVIGLVIIAAVTIDHLRSIRKAK